MGVRRWRCTTVPHARLLAPGTQSQPWSSALPSSLAQSNEIPSIFPSALFVLFSEQSTTGLKRCQLPEAPAALLSNRQILHVQHIPECAEPRPETPATGPSSGSEAEEIIIGLDCKLLFQCFESLVVSKETFGVLTRKKLEWKGLCLLLSPGWARALSPAARSQQGSLMAGHTRYFKSTSKPKWEMERTRWIVDESEISLLSISSEG